MSKVVDQSGNTVLHYSVVHSDDVNSIKKALNEYPDFTKRKEFLFLKNGNGSSAFKLAVEHNRFEIVKYLLQLFLSFPDFEHDPLILKLAAKKKFLNIVKLLFDNGWPLQNKGERETVLHIAAEQNSVLLVKYLLEKEANIEAKNSEGCTPVLSAAAHNSLEVIEVFHKLNLLSQVSSSGETVLMVALKHDSINIINYIIMICRGDKELTQLIFHHPNDNLDTLLHIAAGMGNLESFNKILNFYDDVNPFNIDKETPLHFAVKYNRFKIVQCILEISTFSVNLHSASGTPLFSAVYSKSFDIVNLLIKNGADKCLTFEERKALLKTALLLQNNIRVLKLLITSLISSNENPNMINELRQACIKLAIRKHLTEEVEYLLDVSDWKDVMRKQVIDRASPIQNLIKYMPEIAVKMFDRCIQTDDDKYIYYYFEFIDDTYYIQNETKSLTPEDLCVYDNEKNKLKPTAVERKTNYHEILEDHPLTLMLKHHRHDLLSHELVKCYINRKWDRFVKWGYYSLCLYHLSFALFLTMIIFTILPSNNIDVDTNDTIPCSLSLFAYEKALFVSFFITHILYTFYKLWVYFNLLRCFNDIIIIILTFVNFYSNCYLHNSSLFILYFCVCLSFANMVKKLPRFGVYVLLTFHTLKSFLRFAPVFLMFLMPFVVVFYVLLNENRQISSFFHIFIRTLVMMIGELEYQDSIATKATTITNIVFCLFLLLITVLLMNLLIGLAVSDTTAMLQEASRLRIKLQIQTIHRIESDMPKFLRRYFWRGYYKAEKPAEDDESPATTFRQFFRWFGLSKEVLKKQKLLYEPLNHSSDFDNGVKFHLKENSESFAKMMKEQKKLLQINEKLQQRIDQMMQFHKKQDSSFNYIDE